jgi:hypothetical protein
VLSYIACLRYGPARSLILLSPCPSALSQRMRDIAFSVQADANGKATLRHGAAGFELFPILIDRKELTFCPRAIFASPGKVSLGGL